MATRIVKKSNNICISSLWLFVLTLIACTMRMHSGTAIAATPNIVLMIIDDLGHSDISHYGAEYSTPNIDRLIKNGVELTNYHVHLSCSPTRSSILTGLYSWHTGLQYIGTIAPGTTPHLPFEFPTIAEVLSQNFNYQTYAIGKWHVGYANWSMTPTHRGFDSFFGYFQGCQSYYNHSYWSPHYPAENGGFDFWNNETVAKNVIGNYSTSLYADRFISFLDSYNKQFFTSASAHKPFFIYLAFQTIHNPIFDSRRAKENELPPKLYSECNNSEIIPSYGRQVYCHKIKYLDETIGNMLTTFEKNYPQLWNNSIIIGTTDNGGMPNWIRFGTENLNDYYKDNLQDMSLVDQSQSFGCNYPYRGGKSTLFQGGIKGVGFLYGNLIDERRLNGTQSNILSHSIDWFPTIVGGIINNSTSLFVSGLNITIDGMNMWFAIDSNSGKMGTVWNRTTLYVDIETREGIYGIIHNGYKLIEYDFPALMPVYDGYYFCNQSRIEMKKQSRYLFNILQDPYETTNLLDSNNQTYTDIAKNMRQMIEYQIEHGNYYYEQNKTFYEESLPYNNNGIWMPWL